MITANNSGVLIREQAGIDDLFRGGIVASGSIILKRKCER